MIVPDKVYSFNSSVIGKIPYVLDKLVEKSFKLDMLYKETANHFEDITEFIYAIDTLYVLGRVKVSNKDGVIEYVKRD